MFSDASPSLTLTQTVSVVINNFNYARYVGEAIQSALSQSVQPTEVIVVDDGSTDTSWLEIQRFSSVVTCLRKDNGGQASAVNRGFCASSGDIVIFLDSDDLLNVDCIETVLLNWTPEVTKLAFNLSVVDQSGRLSRDLYYDGVIPSGSLGAAALEGRSTSVIPMSGNAFSRQFLTAVMPIPEDVYKTGADTYLFELAPLFGIINAVQLPLGRYRVHGRNWSGPLTESGRVDLLWLERRVTRDEENERALRRTANSLGLVAGRRGKQINLGRLQLLQVKAAITERRGVLRRLADAKQVLTAIGVSSLSPHKRLAILLWSIVLAASPRSASNGVAAWGLRHGFIVAITKFLIPKGR